MSSVNRLLSLSGAKSSTVLDSAFGCAYTNKQVEQPYRFIGCFIGRCFNSIKVNPASRLGADKITNRLTE